MDSNPPTTQLNNPPPTLDKEYLIQLTQNLYRLTLLFPKKEPLRYKMRELADEILANSLRITNHYEFTNIKKGNLDNQHPVLVNLEILDGFFEVAKAQNWVSLNNILKLQQEYSKLREELDGLKERTKKLPFENEKEMTQVEPVAGGTLVQRAVQIEKLRNERQEKILTFLKENGRAQVWQLKEIFPEVSKRTLRRDFESLLKQGKIERIGQRNETFYQLKDGT